MADEAEVALLRQLLEFAQRDAGYADELRARLAAVERERDEARADAESHREGADAWHRRAMSARAKRDAALARIAAVEADRDMYAASLDSMTMRLVRLVEAARLTPTSDDGEGMEGALKHFIAAALAASPTPERCGEFGIELWEMRCEYVPGGRHTHYPTRAASPTPTTEEQA